MFTFSKQLQGWMPSKSARRLRCQRNLKLSKDRKWIQHSYSKLAAGYGIGKSTVHDIIRQKEKLRKFVGEQEHDIVSSKQKRMGKANNELLDHSVYLWFCFCRNI